jgi:hypothetical protein
VGAKAETKSGSQELGEETQIVIRALTDDLVAGGRLSATFNVMRRETDPAKKESVLETSGPLVFRVRSEVPWYTVSTGLVMTTAPEPVVAIVKTANVVTFQKDGKEQRAYEQKIVLRDADANVKPIQSAVSFLNFRLSGPIFASAGVQLNQKLFEEPLLGLTYRRPLGRLGLNFTCAAHLSRELEILSETGFDVKQAVDPTLSLTVDDIPTKRRYHVRPALGFSVDF